MSTHSKDIFLEEQRYNYNAISDKIATSLFASYLYKAWKLNAKNCLAIQESHIFYILYT